MQKICPRCGQKYTKKRGKNYHHVYPKWLFGVIGNNETEEICRTCHDELHIFIREWEKSLLRQHKATYRALFMEFMST